MAEKEPKAEEKKSSVKEYLLGIIALALGGYNLAVTYGLIESLNINIPQIIANIVLVIAGILLIIAGFRRSRHEYFKKRFIGRF